MISIQHAFSVEPTSKYFGHHHQWAKTVTITNTVKLWVLTILTSLFPFFCSAYSPFEKRRERRSQSTFSSSARAGSTSGSSSNLNNFQFPPGTRDDLFVGGEGDFYRPGSGGEPGSRPMEEDFIVSRTSGGSFEVEDSYERELREYGFHQSQRREQQYKDRSRSLSPRDR